ncbi:MAG: hypothetical protein NC548_58645 [Lachnospiraceae bacterium]|nr:hypothetical protein [Lachnospiraceae bacterium]
MKDKDVINFILIEETEIVNKMHHAVSEIMRLGYDTERGKKQVHSLIIS